MLALLLLPAAASAGTASVVDLGDGPPTQQRVNYIAPDGEGNRLQVSYDAAARLVTLTDSEGITPGTGCFRPSPANAATVRCAVTSPGTPGIVAFLADGDDVARVDNLAAELNGNGGNDELTGGPGRNTLRGGGGFDKLTGGRLADVLRGGPQGDIISGRRGDDRIRGEGGDDDISGGGGDDRLNGGRGEDAIKGRSGRDVINARDTLVDRVSCGRGRDRAKLDGFDHLADACERVKRPFPPGGTIINALFEAGELRIDVGCPRDAPKRCRGRVSVLRKGERIATDRINLRHGRLRELALDVSAEVAEDIADADRYLVTVVVRVRDRLGRTRIIRVRFDLAD